MTNAEYISCCDGIIAYGSGSIPAAATILRNAASGGDPVNVNITGCTTTDVKVSVADYSAVSGQSGVTSPSDIDYDVIAIPVNVAGTVRLIRLKDVATV